MKRNYVICRRRNLENLKRFAEFLEFVQEHFITQSRERLYTLYIIHETLYILHYTLYIIRYTLYRQSRVETNDGEVGNSYTYRQPALYTIHYAVQGLYILHYTLFIIHYTGRVQSIELGSRLAIRGQGPYGIDHFPIGAHTENI